MTARKMVFALLIALVLFAQLSIGATVVALAAGPGEVNFAGWPLCEGMTERNPTQTRLVIYNPDTAPEQALNEPAGAVGFIAFDGNLFGGSFSLSGEADYTIVMISGNARVANTVKLHEGTDQPRPDDFCNGPSLGIETPAAPATQPTQPSAPTVAAKPTAVTGATGVATTTVTIVLPAGVEETAVHVEIRAGEKIILQTVIEPTQPTQPTAAPTAKAAETKMVEVKIEGDVDTLYEAWTQAYGSAPTHDQWMDYAEANGLTIFEREDGSKFPIVHFGDVLTFEVPTASQDSP